MTCLLLPFGWAGEEKVPEIYRVNRPAAHKVRLASGLAVRLTIDQKAVDLQRCEYRHMPAVFDVAKIRSAKLALQRDHPPGLHGAKSQYT